MYFRAVQHADDPSHGHNAFRVLQNGNHDAQQCVAFKDGVRIHHANVWGVCRIQAGVHRVSLTASRLFVDDQKSRVNITAVQSTHQRALDFRNVHCADQPQAKLLAHFLECAIFRSIVDNDDLEFRVIQLQEVTHSHADGAFFVMRGGYDRDGRRHGRVIDPAQAMALQTALMRRAGLQGNHQHQQISEIAGQVIPEERVVRDVQKSNHGSNAALSGELSLTAGSPV